MPTCLATKTRALLVAASDALREIAPCSVRAVAYRCFTTGAIGSMGTSDVARLARVLLIARERGWLSWDAIVDESRELERVPSWADPADFAASVRASYRRDRWQDQPSRLLCASEKGTVRGTLAPVIDAFGVPFLVAHGFLSATLARDLAALSAEDARPLTILYVGDHDPSGRYMSDEDLPQRLRRYGGEATVERLALVEADLDALP